MNTATARAYRSRFSGRILPFEMRKSPQNKAFYGYLTAYSEEAHCIKDRVLLDGACGTGAMLVHLDILEEYDNKLCIVVKYKSIF